MEHFDTLIASRIHSLGWPLEAFVQLLLAAAAGGLVGLEREVRGRQAGFRTNLLVCVGSALVMIVSTRFAFFAWPRNPGFTINVDPARIAYGVMTGIGFLGAGTILQHKGSVRGLTTAAALWCTSAIGLASGMGMYSVGLFTSMLVLLALWLLDYLERALPRTHYRGLIIRRRWEPGCVSKTTGSPGSSFTSPRRASSARKTCRTPTSTCSWPSEAGSTSTTSRRTSKGKTRMN